MENDISLALLEDPLVGYTAITPAHSHLPSFPYMYFKQIGGSGALPTLSNTEDGINLVLEIKFYSNKTASEARKIANSAREYMVGIGFHCDYFSPVENVSDTSISQFLARFSKLET